MQLNVMRGRLSRAGLLVLDECDESAIWDLRGEQLGRGDAGEVTEVAVEMGLVVVAARVGDVGQRRAALDRAARLLEAQDAGQRLRRQAELGLEACGEVP